MESKKIHPKAKCRKCSELIRFIPEDNRCPYCKEKISLLSKLFYFLVFGKKKNRGYLINLNLKNSDWKNQKVFMLPGPGNTIRIYKRVRNENTDNDYKKFIEASTYDTKINKKGFLIMDDMSRYQIMVSGFDTRDNGNFIQITRK